MKKVLNIVLLFILGLGLISCDRMLKDPLVAGSGFGDVILNEADVTVDSNLSVTVGALNLTSGKIKVDGTEKGTVGTSIKNILSGTHKIDLEITKTYDDGKFILTGSKTINVTANDEVSVGSFSLSNETGYGSLNVTTAGITIDPSVTTSAVTLDYTKAKLKIDGVAKTFGTKISDIKTGNVTMLVEIPSIDGKTIYFTEKTVSIVAPLLTLENNIVLNDSKNGSFVNGVVKLSVKAPTGKTAVNLHTWGTDATGAGWPGAAMKDEGNGWFTYTIKGTELDGLIFNWDGGQTGNLTVDGAGNYFYDATDSAWIDAIKVNVKAPAGKTAVNLHTWGTDATGAGWPGVAMKDEGNGWFSYIVEGPSLDGLIFNWDGGQTGNLTVDGAGEYFYDATDAAWLDVIKLNVIAPTGKTAVNLHTWGTDATGAGWPGVAMKDEGNGWFSYIVEGPSLDGLIFNWDGGQTGNLTVDGAGEYFYDANSSTWFE